MTNYTVNFNIPLPDFDKPRYQEEYYTAMRIVDSIMAKYIAVNNVRGVWQNSTVYAADDVAIDEELGILFRAANAHTSAAPSTTFSETRTAFPNLWVNASLGTTSRSAWAANVSYSPGDFVVADSQYALCIAAHTSGPNFAGDSANWEVLINGAEIISDSAAAATEASADDLAATAALYDLFDDRFLGSKSSVPTLDNDGDAILEGAIYWNTVSKASFVWNGSMWINAIGSTQVTISANDSTAGYLINKLSASTGIVLTEVDDGSDESISIAVNVGTDADEIVQLDGSSKLPAVDASQVTGLTYSQLTGGPVELLDTVTASNDAYVTFDTAGDFDGTYPKYIIEFVGVRPATNNQQLYMELKRAAGWETGANTYKDVGIRVNSSGTSAGERSATGTSASIIGAQIGIGNTEYARGSVELAVDSVTDYAHIKSYLLNTTDFAFISKNGDAQADFSAGITGVRFYFASGNVSLGTFNLYGVRV